jgi:hypothetical protein
MSRQIDLYEKVAADYDRMALLMNDQRLRNMFLCFAQQWREAASESGHRRPTRGSETLELCSPILDSTQQPGWLER